MSGAAQCFQKACFPGASKGVTVWEWVNPFWEKLYQNPGPLFSLIPSGVPLPHRNALQCYVKRKKM